MGEKDSDLLSAEVAAALEGLGRRVQGDPPVPAAGLLHWSRRGPESRAAAG